VLDLRGHPADLPVPPDLMPSDVRVQGVAVLFNFGWVRHWGGPSDPAYPYISTELAGRLADGGAKLLGFDTGNADGPGMPAHPVHTLLLAREVLIVENLTNLDALHGKQFRFFAIPIKGRGLASMSGRAFAELL
jgi:kynurenine formamidase